MILRSYDSKQPQKKQPRTCELIAMTKEKRGKRGYVYLRWSVNKMFCKKYLTAQEESNKWFQVHMIWYDMGTGGKYAGAAVGRDLNIDLKVFAKCGLCMKLLLSVKCVFGHIWWLQTPAACIPYMVFCWYPDGRRISVYSAGIWIYDKTWDCPFT